MNTLEKVVRFLIYIGVNGLVGAMFFLGPIVIILAGCLAIWIGFGQWGSTSYSMIALGAISIIGASWCICRTWWG